MTGEGILRIETRTGSGEPAVTEAKARCFEKKGRNHVLFEIEGDRCRLKFDEKALTYRRSGELAYELRFLPGEETETAMVTPYGTSRLTCMTYLYEKISKEDEMVLNLRYNVAGEDCDMKIVIVI